MSQPKFNPKQILVIGDAHIGENQNLDRFTALGNLIDSRMPDEIIIIGDFLTFDCLSAWDKSKRGLMEGRRRSAEIAAGNEALDSMLTPCIKSNEKRRRQSKRQYHPELTYIEGNHEYRERRYLEEHPELIGSIDYRIDLRLTDRGFNFVPYRCYWACNGISFTHIPMNKANQPIGGVRYIQTALQIHAHSIVFGHTHELKIDGEHRHGAEHFNQALAVGCFFEHTERYAAGSKKDHWKGIVILHNYSYNRFDLETISMARLKGAVW